MRMNILILAAGYATRLYPLTLNLPKPLLPVAGKPMMEWVIDNLAPIQGIEKVYVVTNHKFAEAFQNWASQYNQTHAKISFEIIDEPENPPSTLIGIALYFYPATTVQRVAQYLEEGNNPDQPGRFIQWLYPRTPVQTWCVPGTWFDVGSKETLEEANKVFAKFAEK